MPEFDGRGFKIHYVEQGEGPAVVFAHGFVMDHTMFAPQFEDLPDTYRCVAWDMRGHGESDCPPGPWAMQDTVVDMIHFIEELNADPCHLVGMSWGGMIAMRVALQREDLLRSLTLIDTSADEEAEHMVPQLRMFRDTIAAEGVSEPLAEAGLALLFGEKYRSNETEAMAIHMRRLFDMPPEALVDGLDALLKRDSVVDRLGEIRVPTLVIHGTEDASIPVAQAEALANGIPKASLVTVPQSGHTCPLEAPDIVNNELADFLASV